MHRVSTVAVVLLVAACNSPAATPKPIETPAFDLSAVQAELKDECEGSGVLTKVTCDTIDIAGMTAEGPILNVPTNLAPTADNVAELICSQITRAAGDLGVQTIGILDSAGGNLYAC